MRFGGIDIAWSTGRSGVCIIDTETHFLLLYPDELLEVHFGEGLYFIDAPLSLPEEGIRNVDKKIRRVTSIPVLPANRKLYPVYLPEEFLGMLKKKKFKEWEGERTPGFYYAESFVPFLRKQFFGKVKLSTAEEYRRVFSKKFGFLPQPPSPHLMDAYLLAKKAKEAFDGKIKVIEDVDGRIYL